MAEWGEHLLDSRRRSKMDVLGGLFSLEAAKYLLETVTTFQEHKKAQEMEYWIFEDVVGEVVRIRIIVRSIKDGGKHLYSVIRRGSIEAELNNP